MRQSRPFEGDWILRDLTDNELLTLQNLLNSGFAVNDVFGVVLHVAAIEHCVFGRADINESRFHSGQYVLHLTDINVAVDLRHIVCGTTDVVLNQTATFHHRNLGEIVTNLHSHEVTTNWSTIALATFATFNYSSIGPIVVTDI